MAKTLGVININGRRYDAGTGAAIDGIRRISTKKLSESRPQAKDKKTPPNKSSRNVGSSARSVHNRQQKSQTLLRTAVFKPSIKLKTAASGSAKKAPKTPAGLASSSTSSRARLISKHPLIERFGKPNQYHSRALSGEIISSKTKNTARADASAQAAAAGTSTASHQYLERLLDEALHRADSHKQSLNHTKKSLFGLYHRFSFALIGLALIIIAAVIVWLNVPAVALKVAAVRAHVSASLPAYTPSGFRFDNVASQPDKVSITYKAASGNGTYTLGEQKSSWDSKTLVDNSFANGQVQTSQVDGNTVYIYGSSDNATWVNNGVLYSINNQAGLNSDQLLQIVQSM